MNESAAFGFLMLNLLHSKLKFNIRQKSSSRISMIEQVLSANKEIVERIQKEKELGNELTNFLRIFFVVFIIIIICIFILPKVIYLFWFYVFIILLLELYFFFILMQSIYFSFAETRDFIIIKIIKKFQKRYSYPYYDFELKRNERELREFNDRLIRLGEDEKEKDKQTVLNLRNSFSKDDLFCIKTDFCNAKGKQEKNLQEFSEIFSIILVSLLALLIISLIPQLQEILESQAYNGIFGSSIFIFISLPICKYFLIRTPPSIEIYEQCISLLDKAIN